MFKEKTTKKRLVLPEGSKEKTTLDARHQQMIQQLQQGIQQQNELEAEKEAIQQKLSYWKDIIYDLYYDKKAFTPEYELAWTSNLFYVNRIQEIEQLQKRLLNASKEVDYYVDTANILFDYYTLLENQESVVASVETAEPPVVPKNLPKGKKRFVSPNQKSILEAFQLATKPLEEELPRIQEESYDSEQENDRDRNQHEHHDEPCLDPDEFQDTPKDKVSLVDEYLHIIDPNHIKYVNHSTIGNCQACKLPLTCLHQEGIMICHMCGYQELLLVEQNRPIYRQSNKEASHQSYKRINHFNEWISQIQGKESTDIPEEIFERIVQEIKKEKIKDTNKLSYNKMREILKKLKYNKYYEHIYYIIYRLNGISPPNFSPDLEEKLRNMFKEIQGPFLKHCPKNRKNFLSYSYVLFKFCQLLDKDEYLKHFSLLKSREKLHVQDQIWRKICEEVQWEFIQSI